MRDLRTKEAGLVAGLLLWASASFATTFNITIDARPLTTASVTVVGETANLPTTTSHTVSLDVGTYSLVDVRGHRFQFEVTSTGLVDYDDALEGFLDGAGTGQLLVRGFDLLLDARALTTATIRLADYLEGADASVVHPFTGIPGAKLLLRRFSRSRPDIRR